jgi:hypothetical protein
MQKAMPHLRDKNQNHKNYRHCRNYEKNAVALLVATYSCVRGDMSMCHTQ